MSTEGEKIFFSNIKPVTGKVVKIQPLSCDNEEHPASQLTLSCFCSGTWKHVRFSKHGGSVAAERADTARQCKPFAVDQEDKNRDQYVISSEQKKEVKVLLMTFDSFMKETTSLRTLKTNKMSYQPRGVTQANFHPAILELKREGT